MSKALNLLNHIQQLTLEMQYIGRKISRIDDSARNETRGYYDNEIIEDDDLETEQNMKRKQYDKLMQELREQLQDDEKVEELKEELREMYLKARNNSEKSVIQKYFDIMKQACKDSTFKQNSYFIPKKVDYGDR